MDNEIKMPKRLTGDAKKRWKEIIVQVEIEPQDVEGLACYCECYASYLAIMQQINSPNFQYLIDTNGGKTKMVNPLCELKHKELDKLLKFARRFYLDPESRGMKKRSIATGDDEWNELIR